MVVVQITSYNITKFVKKIFIDKKKVKNSEIVCE